MLLYFPEHNHPIYLSAYRTIILAERWSEKVDSMERLALVCEHLFELPSEWRSIVALEVYSSYLFPVIEMLVHFEEDKEDSQLAYRLHQSPKRKEQVSNFRLVSYPTFILTALYLNLFNCCSC